MSLDPGEEVVDEDLGVEEVAGVSDPVDVKQVGVAGVHAHPHHLDHLEAGEALLPDKHDRGRRGEADQGHVLRHQNHLDTLPNRATIKLKQRNETFRHL